MMNILNGGTHADSNVDFQEFMVMPVGAETFSDALRWGTEVFHTLKGVLKKKGYNTAVGDEGGFAPILKSNAEAIDLILEAIELAGYTPGEDIAIALDPAASEFYDKETGKYVFKKSDKSAKLLRRDGRLLGDWVNKYPIVSHRRRPGRRRLGRLEACSPTSSATRSSSSATTSSSPTPSASSRASKQKVANSILIKVNQIGTVSETLEAIELGRRFGYTSIISHRSRRNRRHLHRRPRRRHRRRPDQNRLRQPHRPHRQIQPAPPHRRSN